MGTKGRKNVKKPKKEGGRRGFEGAKPLQASLDK